MRSERLGDGEDIQLVGALDDGHEEAIGRIGCEADVDEFLVDEVLAGLDADQREQLRQLLLVLRDRFECLGGTTPG